MSARTLSAIALALLTASPSLAAPLAVTEQTETKGVFGISIPFGPNAGPRFSVGVRRATVDVNGDLRGTELRLILDPANPANIQFRAIGLLGTTDHAGALGGGWDFGSGRPFASGGVVLPYFTGIADFGLSGFEPQITVGFDSLGRFDTPTVPVFSPCGVPAGPGSIVTAC